jgi:exopolysaccharide biosynthesis polyprenyl glycosylphosphotransferase
VPDPGSALIAAAACGLVCAAVLEVFRRIAGVVIRRRFAQGRLLYRVAVLGEGPEAANLRDALRARAASGVALEEHSGPETLLASWGSFDRFCLHRRIDALVIDSEDFRQDLGRVRGAPAEVLCCGEPRRGEQAFAGHPLDGLMLTRLQRPAMSEGGLLAKTAFDMTAAALLLIGILPTLVAVAIAIKLETRGPVLFRQPRIGYANQPFSVFKFRTMYHDMTDMMAARQTERGDPRVTRVGRLLRRLSIDELPQLLNVLRGDMSLVGPRPHAPHTNIDGYLLQGMVSDYVRRHRVKPGITGWAQINGSRGALRTPEQLKRRVRLDLIYIARWSLWLDIRILVLTLFREVFSKDAF